MLILYSGQHCHLCELAENLVKERAPQHYADLEKQDVAKDPTLYHLYGARIPVLKRTDTEQELGWPFDAEKLNEFLA